jgi:hypothetical protein
MCNAQFKEDDAGDQVEKVESKFKFSGGHRKCRCGGYVGSKSISGGFVWFCRICGLEEQVVVGADKTNIKDMADVETVYILVSNEANLTAALAVLDQCSFAHDESSVHLQYILEEARKKIKNLLGACKGEIDKMGGVD